MMFSEPYLWAISNGEYSISYKMAHTPYHLTLK